MIWYVVWQQSRILGPGLSKTYVYLNKACQFVPCYMSIKEVVSIKSQNQALNKEKNGQIQYKERQGVISRDNFRQNGGIMVDLVGWEGLGQAWQICLCCLCLFSDRCQMSLINHSDIRETSNFWTQQSIGNVAISKHLSLTYKSASQASGIVGLVNGSDDRFLLFIAFGYCFACR